MCAHVRKRAQICMCAHVHVSVCAPVLVHTCVCVCACHYVGSCVCFRVCTQGRALKKRSLGAVLLVLGLAPGTAPCWAAAARHEEGGLVATGLLVRGWPQKGTERGASGAAGAQLVLLDTLFPVAPLPPSHLQPSLPRVLSLHVPRLHADLPAPAPWGAGCCTSGQHIGAGCAEPCLPCSPPRGAQRGPAA